MVGQHTPYVFFNLRGRKNRPRKSRLYVIVEIILEVAKCDRKMGIMVDKKEEIMNNTDIQILDKQTIESMIYTIRGQKVMLDFDLARIYGYETRDFNKQVKNNVMRFDNDFRFQLTIDKCYSILMWKNSTSSWGGTRKLPYAFTEQGIYMLMTVLKGENYE